MILKQYTLNCTATTDKVEVTVKISKFTILRPQLYLYTNLCDNILEVLLTAECNPLVPYDSYIFSSSLYTLLEY